MQVNPYRAVFIDLDGTLLNPNSLVSDRNESCLRALIKRGVKIIFATGRPIESVRQLVGRIHSADPVISLSGSMIHRSMFGEMILAHMIPFETMHNLLEECRRIEGIENILLDEADGFYALNRNPELVDFIGMYRKEPQLFTFDSLPESPVLSVMIYARQGRRQIYESLQEKFGASVHFSYFKEYPWIELSALGSNKGLAMSLVCKELGLLLTEVIAIGDGANDLEMIAAAGLGIAVDNADDEIKAVADRIAPASKLDGLAIVLEDIFGL